MDGIGLEIGLNKFLGAVSIPIDILDPGLEGVFRDRCSSLILIILFTTSLSSLLSMFPRIPWSRLTLGCLMSSGSSTVTVGFLCMICVLIVAEFSFLLANKSSKLGGMKELRIVLKPSHIIADRLCLLCQGYNIILYDRVAQIKKVVVLMAYFLLSDH